MFCCHIACTDCIKSLCKSCTCIRYTCGGTYFRCPAQFRIYQVYKDTIQSAVVDHPRCCSFCTYDYTYAVKAVDLGTSQLL